MVRVGKAGKLLLELRHRGESEFEIRVSIGIKIHFSRWWGLNYNMCFFFFLVSTWLINICLADVHTDAIIFSFFYIYGWLETLQTIFVLYRKKAAVDDLLKRTSSGHSQSSKHLNYFAKATCVGGGGGPETTWTTYALFCMLGYHLGLN